MPFSGYKDHADCVAQNGDKADPAAFCSALERETEKLAKADATRRFEVVKFEDDKQLVFGYASVSLAKDGALLEDLQGDTIDPQTLEDAAYGYALKSRAGHDMHGDTVVMDLVESLVLTPEKLQAMGLVNKNGPTVGFWVGYKVRNREDYLRVKRGERRMFSIRGTAEVHGE